MVRVLTLLSLVLLAMAGCGSPGGTSPAVAPSVRVNARLSAPVTVPLRAGWTPVGFQCSQVTSLTPGAAAGLSVYTGGAYQTLAMTPAQINAADGGRRGFWVFSPSASALTYDGTDDGRGSFLSLAAGWNLVSIAGSVPVPGTSLVATPGPLAASVLTTFYELQPDGSQVAVDVAAGGVLQPGRACWVYAAAPVRLTWTVAPSASPSPVRPAVTRIEVLPAQATLTRFSTLQLRVLATLADGSTRDVTSEVEWTSDVPSAVAVSSSGLATALFPLPVTVTARLQGQSATTSLTVTDAGQPGPIPAPSPTPVTWVTRTSGTTAGLRAVAFGGPGRFVVVGDNALCVSDDGLAWSFSSGIAAGLGTAPITTVASAGGAGFFASGEIFRLFTSALGLTWNNTGGVADINDFGYGAAFGNGFGVIVGRFNTFSASRVSADALPFTVSNAASLTTSLMRAVCYGTGTRFVAVGDGGLACHASVTTTTPTWLASVTPTTNQLTGVAFGAARFVAVGAAGTILVSTDNGDNFTATGVTSGTTQALNAVTFGNGVFVAVGDNGTILRSADGFTWSADVSSTAAQLLGVAWSAPLNRFVAVGAGGVIVSTP